MQEEALTLTSSVHAKALIAPVTLLGTGEQLIRRVTPTSSGVVGRTVETCIYGVLHKIMGQAGDLILRLSMNNTLITHLRVPLGAGLAGPNGIRINTVSTVHTIGQPGLLFGQFEVAYLGQIFLPNIAPPILADTLHPTERRLTGEFTADGNRLDINYSFTLALGAG